MQVDRVRSITSQVAVWAPGAMGLLIVWRTAAYYAGADALAFWLVVVMGLGLLAGLVELSLRVRGALALNEEVALLPAEPDDDTVDAASPPLRAYLRARIEHAPAPVQPALLTPYLIGLLVMLGLLGTFMGLFETLRGAGQALSASGDLVALRAGLADPLSGLTRSFGSSAAGVCTSAMLGLAAVFARRDEGRAARAVQGYCTGPLRSLSPLRRQLAALDRLAADSAAWPDAARSLSGITGELKTLSTRWEEGHSNAAQAQQQALLATADKVGVQLQTAARNAAASTRETVAPLVRELVSETAKQSSEHLAELRAALRADQAARREEDARLRKAAHEAASEQAKLQQESFRAARDEAAAQVQALTRASSELTEYAETNASTFARSLEGATEQLHTALTAFDTSLSTELQRSVEARQQAERAHIETLRQLASQLDEGAQAREMALGTRWEQLAEAVEAHSEHAQARAGAQAEQLSELAANVEQGLGAAATSLREQAEQRAAFEAQQQQSMQAAHAAQQEVAQATFAEQREAASSALEHLREGVQSVSAHSEAQAERLAGLEQRLSDTLTAQAQQLTEALAQQAERLDAVDGALHARHEEAMRALQEAITQQTERMHASEAGLSQVHHAAAERLAEQLTEHAVKLGEGLGASDKLVTEAAATLQASSAEMGAVAEMFAAAVDRQRDAAQTWLDNLAGLEDAVEQAGRGAAADALGEQLASTQEVFARQLQYQRELFEQLRTMRDPDPMPAPTVEGAPGDATA